MGVPWVLVLSGSLVFALLFYSSGSEVVTVDVRAAKDLLGSGYHYLDVR